MGYALRLPTGENGLSAEATVHSPYLTLDWQLDEQWQVFGDLGVNVRDRGDASGRSIPRTSGRAG